MSEIITKQQSKSGREITFRYPELGDAEILTNYINRISAEKTFLILQGEQFTVEQETKWLENTIQDIKDEKCVYVVAMDGDRIIGTCDIRMRSGISGHIGVYGVVVNSDYRGDGVGEILTRVVIDQAKKNLKDLKTIVLDVFAENERAKNLYKKIGFVEYGILPKGLQRNGEFSDEILMYLNI